MEYYHPGVGTIVQSTWWVQCTLVHVVYGYDTRKVIEVLQVMGLTEWGMGERGGGGKASQMNKESRIKGRGKRRMGEGLNWE